MNIEDHNFSSALRYLWEQENIAQTKPLKTTISQDHIKQACMRSEVLRDFRRLGLGQKLLDTAIDFAKSIGYSRIVLDSSKALHAARALYLKNGFVDIARYNDNYRADVFMERRLT
jgi:GNAT superfamily N-acetyltransferase